MEHIRVSSSQIRSIAYDPATGTMEANFHCTSCSKGGNGTPNPNCKCKGAGHVGTYTYEGVPAQVFATLRDAKGNGESVGTTFHKLVKQAKYKFKFKPNEE